MKIYRGNLVDILLAVYPYWGNIKEGVGHGNYGYGSYVGNGYGHCHDLDSTGIEVIYEE